MSRGIAMLAIAAWGGIMAHPARAHDVTYELHGSGQAQVVFHYQDGSPMAGAAVEIFAPDSGALPDEIRTTDSVGEVVLEARHEGVWRVEAHDAAGHASRARVRVSQGVISLAGQAIPEWLTAASLLSNIVLAGVLALTRRRARARSDLPPSTRQGPLPT